MTPCRSSQEALHNGVSIFPSGQSLVEVRPLNHQLLDGACAAMVESCSSTRSGTCMLLSVSGNSEEMTRTVEDAGLSNKTWMYRR